MKLKLLGFGCLIPGNLPLETVRGSRTSLYVSVLCFPIITDSALAKLNMELKMAGNYTFGTLWGAFVSDLKQCRLRRFHFHCKVPAQSPRGFIYGVPAVVIITAIFISVIPSEFLVRLAVERHLWMLSTQCIPRFSSA